MSTTPSALTATGAELGTPRYDALPAGRYQAALAWLAQQAAAYLPDDPDALPPLQDALL